MTTDVLHIDSEPLCGCAPGDVRLPEGHGFVSIEAATRAKQRGLLLDKRLCLACVKKLVRVQ